MDQDFVSFVNMDQIPGNLHLYETPKNTQSIREMKRLTMMEVRQSLPVFKYREEFLKAVEEHQVLIIVGETGSGKTTQLPQYLHEAVILK